MLIPRFTPGAVTQKTTNGWHLQIPAGEASNYRLAQLDNYGALARHSFPLTGQASLNLRCRASSRYLPGTWGFGFWNDPFAFSLGVQGATRRLPVLPNACWFFNASSENHLAFQNKLPGHGFLAQTFRSPKIPSILLAPGLLGAPFLFSRRLSRFLRTVAASVIKQDGLALEVDPTSWHDYHLSWSSGMVVFSVDAQMVFTTAISPPGPLAVVIWIDNQFAAWTPAGKIGMGSLQTEVPGWLELENIDIRA